jgi:hypothetical protein
MDDALEPKGAQGGGKLATAVAIAVLASHHQSFKELNVASFAALVALLLCHVSDEQMNGASLPCTM